MFRTLFRYLSPAGHSARLSTLIFHRVHVQRDALFPSEPHVASFDAICGWVREWFQVLPLNEALQRLKDGTLPERALSITFDDGYADNLTVALPILQRHGLHATIFVSTGFLDGGRMWNDSVVESVRGSSHETLDLWGTPLEPLGRLPISTLEERRAAVEQILRATKYRPPEERALAVEAVVGRSGAKLPNDLMLTTAQLRKLAASGVHIGAHTVSHPILAGLDPTSARREITDSRDCLEAKLQRRVGLFAYPNGRPGQDYIEQTVAIVQSLNFDAALTTEWGVSCAATDPFRIPRFTPWDRQRYRFGLRMARNLRSAAAAKRPLMA